MEHESMVANIGSIIGAYYYGDAQGVVDILADCLHYCKANNIDFDQDLATARMHFEAEIA